MNNVNHIYNPDQLFEVSDRQKAIQDLADQLKMVQRCLRQLNEKVVQLIEQDGIPGNLNNRHVIATLSPDDFIITERLNSMFLEKLFKLMGRGMTVIEVIKAINSFNYDVFPPQIINVKAYLTRRLRKACEDGILKAVRVEEGEQYYLVQNI